MWAVFVVVQSPSCVWLFVTPWTATRQASRSFTTSQVCPSSCPSHQWCHPVFSSSDTLLSFGPQSFPASGTFPMSELFTSDDQNTGASASTSVFPTNIQGWFLLKLTGLISCCPRDFQKSLASHFEANSLAFCLLYSPALTTIRDHWEDHSLDYMDLCLQSNVSAFQHTIWVCYSFPAKKQSSSDFWTSGVIFTPHLISKPGNGKGMVVNSPEDHGRMCACVWVFVYLVGWKHP